MHSEALQHFGVYFGLFCTADGRLRDDDDGRVCVVFTLRFCACFFVCVLFVIGEIGQRARAFVHLLGLLNSRILG